MYITAPTALLRTRMRAYLDHVMSTGDRVLITRNGHDLAALVSAHDLDRLEQADAHSEEMIEAQHRRMMEDFRRLKEGGW